jgi:PAS domain S-box-containing protein
MVPLLPLSYWVRVGVLCAVYFSAAKLALMLDAVSGFASPVWPPTGIALAALLIGGYRLWPGITLGAFLANWVSGAPLLPACGMAIGNTLEALLGAYLLQCLPGFRRSLDRLRDVLGLVALAAILSTLVSPIIGVSSLWLGGRLALSEFGYAWRAWWVGDMLGNLVVAPLLLTWADRPAVRWQIGAVAQAGPLGLFLVVVSLVVFGNLLSAEIHYYSHAYLILPGVIWAALQFGSRGTTLATIVVSVIAIWGTYVGYGPFVRGSRIESFLFLQSFMGVMAITGLTLAAVVGEHLRAEEALRQHEEHTQLIIDSALDAVITIDERGVITGWNPQAEQTFGWTCDEVMGETLAETIIPPEFREAHTSGLQRFLATGEGPVLNRRIELTAVRRSGQVFPVELSISPLRLNNHYEFSGFIRDITERKRLEERFRATVESAPIAMVMIDREGKIILVNVQTQALFGYAREELLDQSVELLVPERFRAQHPPLRAGFFGNPQARRMGAGRELYGLRKDGSEFPVEIGLNPVQTEEGLCVLSAIVDITERKRSEEQIRASLKEKEVLLREIHHRVKNNLQIISSLLQLQTRQVKDSEHVEIFKESQNRIKSMALIHEKLYQSHDLARVDFAKYLQSLATHLFRSYAIDPQTISLEMSVEDSMLGIDTAIPCGLIVNELVTNSVIHAFPEGKGTIGIAFRPHGDERYILTVRDNGIGFREIPDPQDTRSLGWQLVNALVGQLGATIEVSHQEGTVVTIVFQELRYKERR